MSQPQSITDEPVASSGTVTQDEERPTARSGIVEDMETAAKSRQVDVNGAETGLGGGGGGSVANGAQDARTSKNRVSFQPPVGVELDKGDFQQRRTTRKRAMSMFISREDNLQKELLQTARGAQFGGAAEQDSWETASGQSSPKTFQSVSRSSTPTGGGARRGSVSSPGNLWRGVHERLRGTANGTPGKFPALGDSAPSTPGGGFRSRAMSVIVPGTGKKGWGAVLNGALGAQAFSAPATPGGAKHINKQWKFLMSRALLAPECTIEGNIHKHMITGIKGAVYIRVMNVEDLMRPVADRDFDITVRSGPGNPLVHIRELEAGCVFKIEFTMYISGKYHIALSCRKQRIPGTPFSVDVAPCRTSPKFSIARGPGLRNGTAGKRGSFVIYARDQVGNKKRKGGDTFVVEFNGPADLKWARVEDLECGEYVVTYFPKKAGWYEISILHNGQAFADCPYNLYIEPGDLSAKQSIIFKSDVLDAVAGEPTSFIVQARDAYRNHLFKGGSCYTGKLSSSQRKSSFALNFTDNGDGTYAGMFTAEFSGMYRTSVGAEVPRNSGVVQPCPLCSRLAVNVQPGPAYAANCVIEEQALRGYKSGVPCELRAGEWVSFVVLSFDRCGNRREGGGHRVECKVSVANLHETIRKSIMKSTTRSTLHPIEGVNLRVSEPNSKLAAVIQSLEKQIQVKVADEGDGRYLVSYRSCRVSEFDAHVRLDGDPIATTPVRTNIIPADCDHRCCWAEGKGLEGSEAGVMAHFTVYAADRFGNRQVKGGEQIRVELAGPMFVQGVVHDNKDGTYSVSYRAVKSGRYQTHILLNRRRISGSPFSVFIKNARTIQSHVALLGLGFRQAVADRATNLKMLALDTFNNPMSKGGESFEVRLTLKPGTSCRVQGLRDSTPLLTESEVEELQQNAIRQQGQGRSFPGGAQLCKLDTPSAELIANYQNSMQRSWNPDSRTMENSIGDRSPRQSLLEQASDLARSLFQEKIERMRQQLGGVQEGGEKHSCNALFNDPSGENLASTYDPLAYEAIIKWLDAEERVTVTANVIDCKDGTYLVTYTPQIAGEYTWTIIHNGVDVSPSDEVVHVLPAGIVPSECAVYGYGMRYAIAGELAHFVVQAADKSGNALKVGKENVEIEIYKEFVPPEQESDTLLPVNVVDLADGRYLATFLATLAGTYVGEVRINGISVPKLSFTTRVYPSLVDPLQCKIVGGAVKQGTGGETEAFHVQACDAFGNERHFGGDLFSVVLRPLFGRQAPSTQNTDTTNVEESFGDLVRCASASGGSRESNAEVVDLGNGKYEVKYRVNSAGPYSLCCSYHYTDLSRTVVFSDTMLAVIPATPCPGKCVASGGGLLAAQPRAVGIIAVVISDQWGNTRSLDPLPYEIARGTAPSNPTRSRPASARYNPPSIAPSASVFDSELDADFDTQSVSEFPMSASKKDTPTRMHVCRFYNGTHTLEAAIVRVVDGRELPGGVITIDEASEGFQAWFKSSNSDERRRREDQLERGHAHDCSVPLYTVSYRARTDGEHRVHIKVNGAHISGGPFTIRVQKPAEQPGSRSKKQAATVGGVHGEFPLTLDQYPSLNQPSSVAYFLNSGVSVGTSSWKLPSAPSTVETNRAGVYQDTQPTPAPTLQAASGVSKGRRGAFVRVPDAAPSGEHHTLIGKSTVVFRNWTKGASRLATEQLTHRKHRERKLEELEAKNRSGRQQYQEFLLDQIDALVAM